MKRLLAIITFAAATAIATAQRLEIPLTPFATGEQVASVEIQFLAPLLHVSKPYIDPATGRFGREVSSRAVAITPRNQHGNPVAYDQLVVWNYDAGGEPMIRIPGPDLDAAGEELNIDWVTATGLDQLRVEMRAALRAILSHYLTGPALTATIAQIEAGLLAQLGVIP